MLMSAITRRLKAKQKKRGGVRFRRPSGLPKTKEKHSMCKPLCGADLVPISTGTE